MLAISALGWASVNTYCSCCQRSRAYMVILNLLQGVFLWGSWWYMHYQGLMWGNVIVFGWQHPIEDPFAYSAINSQPSAITNQSSIITSQSLSIIPSSFVINSYWSTIINRRSFLISHYEPILTMVWLGGWLTCVMFLSIWDGWLMIVFRVESTNQIMRGQEVVWKIGVCGWWVPGPRKHGHGHLRRMMAIWPSTWHLGGQWWLICGSWLISSWFVMVYLWLIVVMLADYTLTMFFWWLVLNKVLAFLRLWLEIAWTIIVNS